MTEKKQNIYNLIFSLQTSINQLEANVNKLNMHFKDYDRANRLDGAIDIVSNIKCELYRYIDPRRG